jgi:pyruvate,orthophosphate dikinase
MDFCFLDSDVSPTKEQVGGKGYYLHQMASMGLPVPPAAVVTTDLWTRYQKDPKGVIKTLKSDIIPQVVAYLKESNGGQMPLVSVRSAGAVSMPGMMDTILNVGVDLKSLGASSVKKGKAKNEAGVDEKFQADLHARFLSMYGQSVLGMPKSSFDAHQSFDTRTQVNEHFTALYADHGHELPSNKPEDQILKCVLAVFDSWNNERAQLYRKLHKIDKDAGTAVVIQRMVFGNKNEASATGVVFSRDPSNGDNRMMGEYLVNAQGEDVVSGSHTPQNIANLSEDFPEAFEQIEKIAKDLERKYKQVQDIEFTIEDEKLYILQSRTANCSPFAKLRMLMDLSSRKELGPQEVLDGLTLAEYLDLNVRQIDPAYNKTPDGTGLPASMGALTGRVVFGPSTKYEGQPTIFLAKETTPDDLQAISLATGILTASGGVTSHAAVVARGMGKICVVGCSDLVVEVKDGVEQATLNGHHLTSGDWITVDANRGKVWVGKDAPIIDAKNTQIFCDLEDLVFEANPQWTRITSKVDEVISGKNTLLLTYAFDDMHPEQMRAELNDATSYLTGTLDLTGKLDFLQKRYPDQFLFADLTAEQVFLKKKDILLDIAIASPPGNKFDFSLYLGPYESEHAGHLMSMGFTVHDNADISFDVKNQQANLVVVQEDETRVPDEKMAISSRNALLRVLK